MRTITIKSKRLGRYDDVSPFLVESGALELKINLPNLGGEFFFVYEPIGIKDSPVRGKLPINGDGKITLSNLVAGELRAEVKHYLRGELVETYKVEPLLLKAVDTQLSAMPEIAFLTAECQALREKTEETEKELTRSNERADEAEKHSRERDIAFLSYAWADYQNNVQLNAKNLTLEEFAAVLGYELTAEELEQINNKKEAF